MLYPRQPFQKEGTEEFILDDIPKNDDIDISKVAEIEHKIFSGVTQEEAELFLDFMVYNSRMAFNYNNSINVLDYSFRGQCGNMANLNRFLLEKIGLPYHQFNIGHVVSEDKALMHELVMVSIPIIDGDETVVKNFLIDPSFRQFFIKENCDIKEYYGGKKGNIWKAAPSAGYFFNLSSYGRNLASSLIRNGYMEMTTENVKCYFDAFKFSTIEKESYSSEILLGKCYQTDIPVSKYYDLIKESNVFMLPPNPYSSYLYTPTEIVSRQNHGLFNQVKNFFLNKNSCSDGINNGHHRR